MSVQQFNQVAYGLTQALIPEFPAPIISTRTPGTGDKAQLGTLWVNTATNAAYFLTSIVNNSATWTAFQGGAISGSSLTITPGPISLTGTTGINTSGAAVTTINTGGTGALHLGNATGNTQVTGSLTASTGLTATAGGITATGTSNINTSGAGVTTIGTGGTGATKIGNATGNTQVTGSLTTTTTITASSGNITATAGSFVASTATDGFQVGTGGPILLAGSGSPDTAVTAPQGSLYMNITGSGVADRLWVNTNGATAWTNFVSAA